MPMRFVAVWRNTFCFISHACSLDILQWLFIFPFCYSYCNYYILGYFALILLFDNFVHMFVVEGDCRLCKIPKREHNMTGYQHFPICIIANLYFYSWCNHCCKFLNFVCSLDVHCFFREPCSSGAIGSLLKCLKLEIHCISKACSFC